MWVEWVVRAVMSWWCYDVVVVFVWVEWVVMAAVLCWC